MTDEQRREAREAYYASISFMDAQVGRADQHHWIVMVLPKTP